jgi:chromosome segregation ATPase
VTTRTTRAQAADQPTHRQIQDAVEGVHIEVERIKEDVARVREDVSGIKADLRAGRDRMDSLSADIDKGRKAAIEAAEIASENRRDLADKMNDLQRSVDGISLQTKSSAPEGFLPGLWFWLRPMLGPLISGFSIGMIIVVALVIFGTEGVYRLVTLVRGLETP